MPAPRLVALVTGASRRAGIGAAIAIALARDGWDVATTGWRPYDAAMPWGSDAADAEWLRTELTASGARTTAVEADFASVTVPAQVFDTVEQTLGPVTALVLSHCHGVDSRILDTTVESFDRHFAVNTRAAWLLIREYGRRFAGPHGRGRIVALTSDHVAGNLPYGASKGALDRIVLAAAVELCDLGITANVVNPGPTDTGWMTPAQREELGRARPSGRVAHPDACARMVQRLCSADGGRISGELLHGDDELLG